MIIGKLIPAGTGAVRRPQLGDLTLVDEGTNIDEYLRTRDVLATDDSLAAILGDLTSGDGNGQLSPSVTVTARVVGHVRGDKIRIGKYRPKSGYRRHTGFRSALTQIEIESIGAAKRAAAKKAEPAEPAKPEQDAPAGLPKGYADMTVAEVAEGAKGWDGPALEAALAYEQEHAKRKGAISALESTLAAKED